LHRTDFPDNASGCCILTGNSSDPDGFLNTELPTDARRLGNPAIVSVSFIREMGGRVGMKTPAEIEGILDDLDDARNSVRQLEGRVAELTAQSEALTIAIGPKLWGKAQHIRKAAGWNGRLKDNRFDAIKNYMADDHDAEDTAELEGALCSTDS
jgi:hypothetical protein